jgi:hypothetical protein
MHAKISSAVAVLLLGCFLGVCVTSSRAQTSDQQVLAGKLRFYYVAEPNNADDKPELLDNEAIVKETREGAFWTKSSTVRLQELVRALLCDLGDGGDVTLQRLAARIVLIKDKPIDVYLIDDATEPLNENAQVRWGKWISRRDNRVFPSGIDMAASENLREKCDQERGVSSSPRRDGDLAGEMATGARVDLKSAQGAAIPLFLHALVHTQDHFCSRRHAFGVIGLPTDIGGKKETAYPTFPDLKTAYREAIAETFTLWFSQELYEQMFSLISPQTVLLTEKDPYPSFSDFPSGHECADLTTPSANDWLYSKLLEAAPSKIHEGDYESYDGFVSVRMQDLPNAIMAQNECILALVFRSYLGHIDRDAFLEIVNKMETERPENVNPTTYAFQLLCEAGSKQTAVLPFAYLDYFTGFRAKNLEEFREFFEDLPLIEEWVDAYWNDCHERVRGAVKPKSGDSELSDVGEIDKAVLGAGEKQEQ